jgi:hypothetical protein
MAKGNSKKDDIIKQIESLHAHIKVRFATRLIDLSIQHDFYHFLDLSHTDWYQYAKIALSQVEDQNPPIGNLTPYASGSYDNQGGISLLGLRESIRYAMKDLFAEALVFAEEPWAESHAPATERWSWFYLHQDNTTTVFSESPQVLPYWYWFARANPHLADAEPVAAISQDIAERLSKSAWRFLVNQLPWSLAMQFCPGPKPEQRY